MPEFKKCPPEKPYYLMTVEPGKTYWWCACGKSKRQPFCDGSHSGTEFSPVAYEATEARDIFFCGCKKTGEQPFCDGSHKQGQ
ncbi:MAG: CDGSH iron-sulfur domain-containing protein [Hyphomicrobiales bacterium]|nr:CDGSH iron-sulfur domain-containing protein [Hyphomicrobiales bacterium]